MRTLEKMSTRLPLHSPLFLLGLFLRRLVEGRSKCCSRACLFCRMSPLAMAAAMAPNFSHPTSRSGAGVPELHAPRADCTKQPPLDELPHHQQPAAAAARVTVPWRRRLMLTESVPCVQTPGCQNTWTRLRGLSIYIFYCVFSSPDRPLHDKCHIQTALIITGGRRRKKKMLHMMVERGKGG